MIIKAVLNPNVFEYKGKIQKHDIGVLQRMVIEGYELSIGDKKISIQQFIVDEVPYKTMLTDLVASALVSRGDENQVLLDQAINRYAYDKITEHCLENDIEIE